MKRVRLLNRTRGTIVAREAEVASSWFCRLRGLIGRRQLEPGHGLIIRPCSSVHTFFMAFPIELLFVGEGNQVLRATEAIDPWRIGPIVPGARYVVELPAGAVAESQTTAGDELEWVSQAEV
ncbi:MAG: DUF192 domain-containing protein [Anaerolineae bacterium]|nr:DUF192 domain-containing protein [Anaerolineae bacterium]